MIKVRVMLPPGWSKKMLDERYWLELEDDATLADALAAVKMPRLLAKAFFVCINGTLSHSQEKLNDGDSISFFPIVSSG